MTIFNTIFKMLFKFLSFIIPPILMIILIFITSYFYHYFKIKKTEKIKPKKSSRTDFEKMPGLIKTIFWLWPSQIARDFLEQDPDAFGEFGIHMVCGDQGSGKTMTVVYLLEKWKKKYPRMKIYTNMLYKYEDEPLNTWQDLIARTNGIYGVVNVIDEMPAWLSSDDSKDVPPEILAEICQQRKQKKAIVGTSQIFGKVAKPLREQTHFVYLPKTILGSLTIVKMAKASDYDRDKGIFKKTSGIFIFAHTKKMREAYDTYKKIERYKEKKFSPSVYYSNAIPETPE